MLVENIRMSWNSLISNKMRTMLSLLGIVIGISSVIAVANLGNSLTSFMEEMFADMGADVITLSATPEDSGAMDRFNVELTRTLISDMPEVVRVAPATSQYHPIKSGETDGFTQITATTADYVEVGNLSLGSGRFFTDMENYQSAMVAVVGHEFAIDSFPDRDALGEKVWVYTQSGFYVFTIIGVLESSDAAMGGSNVNSGVIVPYTSYSDRVSVPFVPEYRIQVAPGYDTLVVQDTVKEYFINLVGDDNFRISSPASFIDMQQRIMGIMQTVIIAIASISLLVGGIGIMNIMLVTVVERVKEIGIRKALGATPRNILGQFLIESMMLTFFGGLLGLLFGMGLSVLLAGAMDLTFAANIPFSLIAVFGSSAIGIFFGIYPAWKASKLDPIVALNHE